MRLHPYALLIGLGLGIMAFVIFRHPIFAVLALILGTLGFDILFKRKTDEDKPDDES